MAVSKKKQEEKESDALRLLVGPGFAFEGSETPHPTLQERAREVNHDLIDLEQALDRNMDTVFEERKKRVTAAVLRLEV